MCPKALHNKLKKQAMKLVKAGKMKKSNMGAYVYSTMDKIKK